MLLPFMALEKDCRIQEAGKPIKRDSYGIALKRGSFWKEPMSKLIATYRDSGIIDQLRKKWFTSKCEVKDESTLQYPRQFEIKFLSGAVFMMVIGIVISFMVMGVEFVLKLTVYNEKKRKKSIVDFMCEENAGRQMSPIERSSSATNEET